MRKEMLEQHVHIALVLPVRESVALLQVAPSSPKSVQGLSLHLSMVNAHCPYAPPVNDTLILRHSDSVLPV